jgi:hypothetical protein
LAHFLLRGHRTLLPITKTKHSRRILPTYPPHFNLFALSITSCWSNSCTSANFSTVKVNGSLRTVQVCATNDIHPVAEYRVTMPHYPYLPVPVAPYSSSTQPPLSPGRRKAKSENPVSPLIACSSSRHGDGMAGFSPILDLELPANRPLRRGYRFPIPIPNPLHSPHQEPLSSHRSGIHGRG